MTVNNNYYLAFGCAVPAVAHAAPQGRVRARRPESHPRLGHLQVGVLVALAALAPLHNTAWGRALGCRARAGPGLGARAVTSQCSAVRAATCLAAAPCTRSAKAATSGRPHVIISIAAAIAGYALRCRRDHSTVPHTVICAVLSLLARLRQRHLECAWAALEQLDLARQRRCLLRDAAGHALRPLSAVLQLQHSGAGAVCAGLRIHPNTRRRCGLAPRLGVGASAGSSALRLGGMRAGCVSAAAVWQRSTHRPRQNPQIRCSHPEARARAVIGTKRLTRLQTCRSPLAPPHRCSSSRAALVRRSIQRQPPRHHARRRRVCGVRPCRQHRRGPQDAAAVLPAGVQCAVTPCPARD